MFDPIALIAACGLAATTLVVPQPPATPPAGAQPAQPGQATPPPAPPTPPPQTITPPPPPPMPPLTPEPDAIPVPDLKPVSTQTLEGGLIVEELKVGDGYTIKPGDAVVALYHGTLKADGSVFDSAFFRGEPIAFPLSGVIEGWQKGVPGMKIGGIRKLTIPAAMAYGPGARPRIPANSDLVFVVQLVDALQIEDVKVGEGEAVSASAVTVTTFSMKDKDGKEVFAAGADKPYIWIPGEFQGIQSGIEGMKVGGKRKIKVPKEFNNPSPFQSGRPTGVPLTIDVELLNVRNLPQMGGRR